MEKRNIISLLIILVIGMFFFSGCAQSSGNVKEFNAVISEYSYTPPLISVNVGDIVKITIKNNDGITHGFSLPVFGVQEFIKPGETKTIQFEANQPTTSETSCSTSHGEKLIVEVIA